MHEQYNMESRSERLRMNAPGLATGATTLLHGVTLVACPEAQADGVPCLTSGQECQTCERAAAWPAADDPSSATD